MSDPVRLGLSADAPPLAVEALDRARRDGPGAARLGAIEAGVLAKLALPPGGGGDAGGGDAGGGGGPSAPTAGVSALAKAGAVTLAAGVAILALVVVRRTPDAPPAPVAVATRAATDSAPAPAFSVAEPGPPPISVEDLPAASAVPSASTRSETSARPAASEDPAVSERAEVALLAAAQAVLAARPVETLARCDEHAARFANGTLVQEREVLAIDALLRLGRRPEAEARASRFRAAFPRSGHLRRIEALLAP